MRSAQRSRSEIVIRAAHSALEVYKEKFGDYPEVANASLSVIIEGKSYRVGGAACLYQALTGDGFGHPIQYVKAASKVPGQPPAAPITVNGDSYDVWSYGEDEKNVTASSLEAADASHGAGVGTTWIRNWQAHAAKSQPYF